MAKSVRESKRFKNLVALLNGDEGAAVKAWNALNPTKQINTDAAPAAPAAPKGPPTSQEEAQALVAQKGFVHVKGRVYVTPEVIEAQVRVLKTGKPEIVRTNEKHYIKGVVIFQTAEKDAVAVQNLGEPS